MKQNAIFEIQYNIMQVQMTKTGTLDNTAEVSSDAVCESESLNLNCRK